MELVTKLWKNFKVQPEIWFFLGFILTFTLTVRKVLWLFPLRGEFNEYSGIYLYLSDIFLVLTLVAWVITILYNNYTNLSIYSNVPRLPRVLKLFHVEQFKNLRGGTLIYILLPLTLVVWSFISLIWAENKIVSIFRSVKVLEFYLLYSFVLIRFFYWNVPRPPRVDDASSRVEAGGTILKKIFGFVMIIGLFQAIIGIIQFFLQHSVGLFWLKESLISKNISGVAKIIFNGETFVRAYGLFPHPNILGGFLMFSIFISWLYYKMFHASLASTSSLCESRRVEHFQNLRGGTLIKIFLGIQLLALILTFSKSAILGLFLGLAYIVYMIVPCGTIIGFFKKKKKLILITSLIVVFTAIIAKPDLHSFFIKSLNERSVYTNVSHGTIWNNPVLGIGNGQFVISMENLPVIKENWMLEPAHNVFLLVWSELGLVGFLILVLFIGFILKGMVHPRSKEIVSRETISCYGAGVEQSQCLQSETVKNLKNTFGAIFIGLLFIMFFDHYLWDIQQGSFLLWMAMGFLVGAGEYKENIDKI
jgi:O-antigen ligase